MDIESVDNPSLHQIVFPKIILKEFQKAKIAVIPSQMLLLNYASISDDGDFFQRLVDCTIYLKLKFSVKAKNNKTIGDLFSFLEHSSIGKDNLKYMSSRVMRIPKIVAERQKSQVEELNSLLKDAPNHSEIIGQFLETHSEVHYSLWDKILDSMPNNVFVIPAPKSTSADSLMWINKASKKLLAVQDKNGQLSFSTLKKEIEKVDRMRIGEYKNMKICFLVIALEYDSALASCLDFSNKDYVMISEQNPLSLKSNKTNEPNKIVGTITCNTNTEVILLSQNGLADFLSKDVLHYLDIYKKTKQTGDSYLAAAFALEQ